jgi:hypothetical protein
MVTVWGGSYGTVIGQYLIKILPPKRIGRANLRALLFDSMYSIRFWPALAEHLAAAFSGNFSGIVRATTTTADPASAHQPDSSLFSTYIIFVRRRPVGAAATLTSCAVV